MASPKFDRSKDQLDKSTVSSGNKDGKIKNQASSLGFQLAAASQGMRCAERKPSTRNGKRFQMERLKTTNFDIHSSLTPSYTD